MNARSTIPALSGRLVVPLLGVTALTLVGVLPSAVAAPPPSQSDPVVLRLADDQSRECSLARVAARHHLEVEETVMAAGRVQLVRGTDPAQPSGRRGATATVTKLRKDPCVALAEVETTVTLASDRFHSWTEEPPTPAAASEWQSQAAVSQLDLARAHQTSRGSGAVVAVLDTGVDATHPALAGKLQAGWDYVDGDATPADSTCGCDTDGDGKADGAVGHGTYVTGTVALVAPEARILPLRVLDSNGQGTALVAAQAVQKAVDARVDVISLSFGTDDQTRSQVLEDAIRNAEERGVLVVAAAGNSASSTEHYPANLSTVLAVGATDRAYDGLAPFSNYGRWVSVAAPGTGIVGLAPGNAYVRWSGTSVSTPVVAGQVALLRGVSPSASTTRVRDAVVGSSTSISKIRYGRVNPVASLSRLGRDTRG